MPDDYKKSSRMNTTAQHTHATGKSPAPMSESTIPITRAAVPAIGFDVACTIAGNVITASVIYGT